MSYALVYRVSCTLHTLHGVSVNHIPKLHMFPCATRSFISLYCRYCRSLHLFSFSHRVVLQDFSSHSFPCANHFLHQGSSVQVDWPFILPGGHFMKSPWWRGIPVAVLCVVLSSGWGLGVLDLGYWGPARASSSVAGRSAHISPHTQHRWVQMRGGNFLIFQAEY